MAITSTLKLKEGSGLDLELTEIKALIGSMPKKALQHIQEIESSDASSDPHTIFELRLLKGMCFLQINELDNAEKQFKFCLNHSEKTKNTLQKAQTLNYITQVEFRRNKLQQVLISGNEALSLAKEIDAYNEQALAYNIIGVAYGALYAYEDSLDALLAGLELKEHLDKDLIYRLNANTSNVYFFLGHYTQALDTLKEGIYHIDTQQDSRVHILSEMNFGKIYTKLEKLDVATEHLEKAKAVAERNPEHTDLLTGLYKNLAELYVSQSSIDAAINNFQKAIALAQKEDNTSHEANLMVSLARCYISQEKYELGLKTLNTAFDLSEKSYIAATRLDIHKAYSELHEHLGDYQAALEHYKRYHDLKEEVQGERSQARIQGMMIKNDTERIQSEHKRIATEKELASLRLLKLEQDNKKLVEENTRDGLTGAYNRRYLNEKLAEAFNIAKENQSPLTVMMSDIDFFKQVNDTFSHAIGDEVLRVISRIFMDNTRQLDTVARYGGEEFVVVFDRTHKGTAITIAEKLRLLVQDYPWQEIHPDLKITISIGLANGTDFKDYEALLNHADKYMYTAKRSGKNQVQYE